MARLAISHFNVLHPGRLLISNRDPSKAAALATEFGGEPVPFEQLAEHLAQADVVIEPDVAGFAYDDFKRADDLVLAGEVAMRKALPEVRKWLQAPGEASAPRKASALTKSPPPLPAD